MIIRLTIPGVPVAKGRPRLSKFGVYTPAKTRAAEDYIKLLARNEMRGSPPMIGIIRLSIAFHMPIPKSATKANKEVMRNSWHTVRPDVDNLAKLVLDSLNGILWVDDCQVSSMEISKIYSATPLTVVLISSTS